MNHPRRILVFLALAGCASAPPHRSDSVRGTVRAGSEAEARRVQDLADSASPRVLRILRTSAGPFEIHVVDRALGRGELHAWKDGQGRVRKRRIVVGPDCGDELPFVLAHELVHWNAVGAWERLPPTVAEGLAEWIAARAVPELAERRMSYLRATIDAYEWSCWRPLIDLGWDLWEGPPGGRKRPAYALGTFLVDRIGVEGLRALCLDAESRGFLEVPLEDLLLRARLTEDQLPSAIRAWGATLPEPRIRLAIPLSPETPSD